MEKKEYQKIRSSLFAMYDTTHDRYWFDKVKELTAEYERGIDVRRFSGFLKIHYADGSEYLYKNLNKAGEQFKLSGSCIYEMAINGEILPNGTFFTLEDVPKKNTTGVTIEFKNGCIKEFLSVVSASRSTKISIDTISKYRNSGKWYRDEMLITELPHNCL